MLLQLVAKGLLTDYASEFEDMDQFGMARFVAGLAVETVLERTSARKLLSAIKDVLPGGDEWDQEAGLLDPAYQQAMLRFREEHMLGGVARRLKRGIDGGMNPGEVFSRVQDHVIAAARAHVERLVLDAFVLKARDLPDGDLKVALNLLCDLHALTTIEADRAWFMEHGRLTAARSKAISREVNDLCRKIRPLAVDLVDAFGVPPQMLRRAARRILGADEAPSAAGTRTPCGPASTAGSSSTAGSGEWRGGSASAPTSACCTTPCARSARLPAGSRVLDVPTGNGIAMRGITPGPGARLRRRRHRPRHARPGPGHRAPARRRGPGDAAGRRRRRPPARGRLGRPRRHVHRPALLPRPAPRGRRDGAGAAPRRGDHRQLPCSPTPARARPARRMGTLAGVLGPMCSTREARGLAARPAATTSPSRLSGGLGYFRAAKEPT